MLFIRWSTDGVFVIAISFFLLFLSLVIWQREAAAARTAAAARDFQGSGSGRGSDVMKNGGSGSGRGSDIMKKGGSGSGRGSDVIIAARRANYRCPSPHLYFLLSYFVTFLLTSLHSSDLVLHGVSEPCPYLEPWVFLAIWQTFPTNVAVDILFSLSLFSNFERTHVFADELLQWGKKWHKWVRFISTQLLNKFS